MRAVFSSTYDDKYLFYVPITIWAWSRIGVNSTVVIPYFDENTTDNTRDKWDLVADTIYNNIGMSDLESFMCFRAPEHKQATYAQVARLYVAAGIFPRSEVLLTTDVDMLVFQNVFNDPGESMNILGSDLVPNDQFPMCYAYAKTETWRKTMNIGVKSLQECLDEQLGHEECENMRGNLWARDQELLFKAAMSTSAKAIPRARPGTQFASDRIDRDDAFYLDRLSPSIIDYHMHRPGYTAENFEKIMAVISHYYPGEALSWMMDYRNQYAQLV